MGKFDLYIEELSIQIHKALAYDSFSPFFFFLSFPLVLGSSTRFFA
jgi:hypothetical protein